MPPLLYADPVFLEHHTGDHPESPERLRHLHEYLQDRPILAKYRAPEFKPATPDQLALIHSRPYIDEVRDFAQRGGGRIEVDTVMSRRSFEVASRAAGAAISAVDEVLTGPDNRALCLVRPPGHHALAGSAMGFCLFNNVAVAAAHALQKHQLERVLIVDWDVHHGNGTQDAFYESPHAWFLSAHRFPFYPGTGAAQETGKGAGAGTTFNLPLKFGVTRADYRAQFARILEDVATRCKPELVLISAGFDAHRADPVGSLGLETEDFEPLTKLVSDMANQYCKGRIVSLLEGGYNVDKLAESVECHMQALAG